MALTYTEQVAQKLSEMELNEQLNVDIFVENVWGICNYHTRRSFHVFCCKVKKMPELIEKGFKTEKRKLIRTL